MPKKQVNKKKVFQTISLSLASVTAVGAMVTAGVLYKEDIKSWVTRNKTYSHEELQQKLDENDLAWEEKLKNLISNSDELKSQITEITKEKIKSDAKVSELESELENNKNLSATQIADLQAQLDAEKENNANLDAELSTLQSQLDEANKKISAYEQIIQQYENDATAPVSYYDGETLIKATLVDKGSTYQLSDELLPADTEDRQFVGFAVDGNIVDHNEYVVNTTTVFNAVFDYRITTIVNEESTSAFIRQDTVLNTHVSDATPGANQEFSHWIDADGNVVDTSTTITGAMTLTAVFDEVYNITFADPDGNIASTLRLVNGVLEGPEPKSTTVTDEGYAHYGWRDSNGTYVSDVTTLKADTILTANMVKMRKIYVKYGTLGGNYTKTWSTYAYAIPSLNSNGEISSYYISQTQELTDIANAIRKQYNTTSPTKCWSLVETQSGYLTSIPTMEIGSETDNYYVYLQVNSVSTSGNTNY